MSTLHPYLVSLEQQLDAIPVDDNPLCARLNAQIADLTRRMVRLMTEAVATHRGEHACVGPYCAGLGTAELLARSAPTEVARMLVDLLGPDMERQVADWPPGVSRQRLTRALVVAADRLRTGS